ncbi:MAG: HTH domain-containing protein [Candidatus Brachytrichaceae bacterium NZ_4S206]|jgi:DeoR/GlpR family transcriptional regulator of sugar metabolism
MFGSKQAKQQRLERLKGILSTREVSAVELARHLNVSKHTIYDDLLTLDQLGDCPCEHRGRFSLLRKWYPELVCRESPFFAARHAKK